MSRADRETDLTVPRSRWSRGGCDSINIRHIKPASVAKSQLGISHHLPSRSTASPSFSMATRTRSSRLDAPSKKRRRTSTHATEMLELNSDGEVMPPDMPMDSPSPTSANPARTQRYHDDSEDLQGCHQSDLAVADSDSDEDSEVQGEFSYLYIGSVRQRVRCRPPPLPSEAYCVRCSPKEGYVARCRIVWVQCAYLISYSVPTASQRLHAAHPTQPTPASAPSTPRTSTEG